jgi:hypothetical protein
MSPICSNCGKALKGGRRYPFAALGYTHNQSARTLNVSGSTWQDYMCHGIGREAAERIANKLGVHPYELWPEMIDDDAGIRPCVECGSPFIPGRPHQTYCGVLCRHRSNGRRSMRRYRATDRGKEANRSYARSYKTYLRERKAS